MFSIQRIEKCLQLGVLSFVGSIALMLSWNVSCSAEDLVDAGMPRIVSASVNIIDFKDYSTAEVTSQAGERKIIGAMIVGEGDTQYVTKPWLTKDFAISVPGAAYTDGFCVDFSNGQGSFRKKSLLKLNKETPRVELRVDAGIHPDLFTSGGSFVAYPARPGALKVTEACEDDALGFLTLQPNIAEVFPAHIDQGKPKSQQTLLLQLNTGGSRVSAQLVDESKQNVIRNAQCYSPDSHSGLYDHECRLKVPFGSAIPVSVHISVISGSGTREIRVSIPTDG